MAFERLLHRLDRLVAVVGAEGGAVAPLQQRDPPLRRQVGRAAQRPGVLGRRLPMRADGLRAGRRGGSELEHGCRVASGLGVVREPCGVRRAGRRGHERRQRVAMQRGPAVGRERLLDGHRASSWRKATPSVVDASMPEPTHSSRQASCGSEASASSSQSSACGWDTETAPEQPPGRRAQARRAGQHRVAHRRRDLTVAAREHLGEEERVARRAAVELVGVDAVRLGELRDGVGRQPGQLAARDVAGPGQLSEHDPQRVAQVELVVAVGARAPARAPCPPFFASSRTTSRVASSAQWRSSMTRTVGARRASSRSSALATSCGPASPADGLRQLAAGLLGDVEQRPQRARGEERIACPPQDPRRPGVLVGEASQRAPSCRRPPLR